MADGGREDLFEITLFIDGTDCGVWDKLTGGDLDSDDLKYRPGGNQGQEETLGGPQTVSDITVTRRWKLGRDTELAPFLAEKRGSGECVVVKQPLDRSYNAYGKPIVYNGTLKTVNLPDADSTANAVALLALVINAATATVT
jgi:hypothetical protein